MSKPTKTPVSLLQECCVKKRHSAPMYTLIEDGTNLPTPDKSFVYEVVAFGYTADGRGRNKNNAKHEAANNLIPLLQSDERYRDDLSVHQPEVPRDACPEIDAVSVLMEICVDRNLPIAQFQEQGLLMLNAMITSSQSSQATNSHEFLELADQPSLSSNSNPKEVKISRRVATMKNRSGHD